MLQAIGMHIVTTDDSEREERREMWRTYGAKASIVLDIVWMTRGMTRTLEEEHSYEDQRPGIQFSRWSEDEDRLRA